MNRGQKKHTISIRFKLMNLLLAVTVALSGSMAIVMYRNMRNVLMRESGYEMNLFCRERGMEINTQLLRIEDSVSSVSSWFLRQAEAPGALEKMRTDRSFRDKVLEQAESMLLLSAKRIEDARTIYFRYSLDFINQSEEGGFYVKSASGEFLQEPLTQVLDYPKDDMEHVGWYYLPIERGTPMWLDPYLNENINVSMISYEAPVYCGSTLIGLIGMDIDFLQLLDEINDIRYKETGYMYLKASDGSVHYHPSFLKHEDVHGDEADEVLDGEEEMGKSESSSIIHYLFHGNDRVMVFMTLRNGMKLVLCDGYHEIFRVANDTLNYLLVLVLILFALAAVALILISNHITRPLRQLAAAANQLSTGNYDVEFPRETSDEVGELTRAFRTAVEHLKQYSDSMEALAYQDALTRVKNVAAYRIEQSALEETIQKGFGEFAVVMLDLNYLKETNDRYGHSAGDIVLMKVASIICRTFPLSAVYRIGGDEFTVILKDSEYECRNEKMSELERRIRTNNESAKEPYLRVSVAYGLAVFDPKEDHFYEDVYRRADRKMYEMKQAIHAKNDQARSRERRERAR